MTKSMPVQSDVRSTFYYTRDLGEPTDLYFYEPETAKDVHKPGDDAHEIPVRNGWERADSFSVDREGFSIHELRSAYDRWDDDEAIKATFYPQIVAFVKETVGARRVLVFDHTIRTKANQQRKLSQEVTSRRAPVMLVHCDYTNESGPLRVRQLLPTEAEQLLSRRVAFYNVWKPIHHVVEERPLAMCDVMSSPPADFLKLYLHYRDRIGENYVMRHSPDHEWWYFPRMTPDQAVLLKTYESETDGRARFVGHTAFEDPSSPPHAPFRESVELRAMAFF